MAIIDAIDGPWIIGADWQVPPDDLAASGFAARLGGTIVAPTSPTSGRRTLDYFVVASTLTHVVLGAQVVANSATKPHFAARLVLASGGRQRQVRKVAGPRVLRDLPEGPRGPDCPQPPPPASATQAALDAAYRV